MDQMDWAKRLDRLREGELRLEAPGESGMTAYANTAIYELREYVKALEQGYRRRGITIDVYRHAERTRELGRRYGKVREETTGGAADETGRSVDGTMALRASSPPTAGPGAAACLGYAILGMRQAGFRDCEIGRVIDAIRENMAVASVEDAAGGYEVWRRGREKPEWIGPAAELKTEVAE